MQQHTSTPHVPPHRVLPKQSPTSPLTPQPTHQSTPSPHFLSHPNLSHTSLVSSSSLQPSQPIHPTQALQPPPLEIPQVQVTPPPGHVHPLESPFLTPSPPPASQATPLQTSLPQSSLQPSPLQIPQVEVIPPPGTNPPTPQSPLPISKPPTPTAPPLNFPSVPVVPEIKPMGWGTRERSKTILGVPLPRRRRRPKARLEVLDDSMLEESCSTDPCVDVASRSLPVIDYEPGSMLEKNPVICSSPTYYGTVGRVKHTTGSIDPLPAQNILDAASARKRLILLKMKINEMQAKREVYWGKQATAGGGIAVAGVSMILPGPQLVLLAGIFKGMAAVVSGHGVVMDGATLAVFKNEILECCNQINRLRDKWGEGVQWIDAEGMVRVKAAVFKIGIDRKVLKGEL